LHFPIAICKDATSDYGVTVPDLPGCFSAGTTPDEAMGMAREAIELHLEGLIDAGEPIPTPGSVEEYGDGADYAKATWAIVTVNPSALGQRTTRVTITVPLRMLRRIDGHAEKIGESRSGLLIRAAASYIGQEPIKARRGRPRRVRFRKRA